MPKNAIVLGFVLLVQLACKSSADQPQAAPGLLSLVGSGGLSQAAWSGPISQSQCQNPPSNSLVCPALADVAAKNPPGTLLLVFSDPLALVGTFSIMAVHPESSIPVQFTFDIQGTISSGYETGSGLTQTLTLTARGTNPVSANGVQARFESFHADMSDGALQGSVQLTLLGAEPPSVIYSFILKPSP